MKYSAAEQRLIREDIFRWLDEQMSEQGSPYFTRAKLQTYTYQGHPIKLLDTSKGIRNPVIFDVTLSVMTSIKQDTGYIDEILSDRVIKYSLQSAAPDKGDNIKLLKAVASGDPIVYFKAKQAGIFEAHYPAYVRSFDPEQKVVYLELEEEFTVYGDPVKLVTDKATYRQQIVRVRQNQQQFRAQVMNAYAAVCAVCRLNQYTLIDAAHITPFASDTSVPHVTNGLALCKLHHAAYDQNLLGISPEYKIKIHASMLNGADKNASVQVNFIDINGNSLLIPERSELRPDRDRLKERFVSFNST